MPGLKDYAAFYWNRMDSWWEEDEEIFKHARDPKKRVDVMLSHRPVRVVLGGEVVAQTSNARLYSRPITQCATTSRRRMSGWIC